MLPFDNKSEFQVILNMPEGSTLEQTARVAMEMAAMRSARTRRSPTTRSMPAPPRRIISTAWSAITFCGAGRLSPTSRSISCPRRARNLQSHDIAKRIRLPCRDRREIRGNRGGRRGAARPAGAADPGRRDLWPDRCERVKLAAKVKEIFTGDDGVVDVDWFQEERTQPPDPHRRQGEGGSQRHLGEADHPDPRDRRTAALLRSLPPANRQGRDQYRPGTAARIPGQDRNPAQPLAASGNHIQAPLWCRSGNWS